MYEVEILTLAQNIGVINNLVQQAMDPANRPKALLALWVILVFVLLAATVGSVYGLFAITSSYKPGIVIATILWAFFLGICALFFLSPKLLTALFGSLLGISVNEAGTASGLITKANVAITDIANQIGVIVSGQNHTTDPFIGWMIWIFVIIIALICLPAFFSNKA